MAPCVVSAIIDFASDVKKMLVGKVQSTNSQNVTLLVLAVVCAVAPLDVSQLFMLLLGAATFALLQQPLPIGQGPRKIRPNNIKAPWKCAKIDAPKYVPPVFRHGSGQNAENAKVSSSCCESRVASPVKPQRSTRGPSDSRVNYPSPQRQPSVKPVVAPTFKADIWDAQVEEIIARLVPTSASRQAVDELAALVQKHIRFLVPEADVVGFASGALIRGCAFSVAVPDVDIVVSCDPQTLESRLKPGSVRNLDHRQLQKAALRAFTDSLVASGDFKFRRSAFSSNEPKVTLLRAGSEDNAVPIDLCVNNATNLHNAALLTECGQFDTRALGLALLVRRWARDRGICHAAKGHLSPYAWSLLAIYFMQAGFEDGTAPMLPPLSGFKVSAGLLGDSQLQKPCGKGLRCEISKDGQSVGSLFRGFIDFYATKFDFQNEAVSLRAGRRNPAPHGLPLHVVVSADGSSRCGLTVEDPFAPNRNIGTSMDAAGMDRLPQELNRIHRMMAAGTSLTEMLQPWMPEDLSQSS